jgi:SAM-dependent methyltransferase
VDLNTDYLARARRRAAARGVRIDTVAHDMRDLAALPGGPFDAAIMMYTSFGYFEQDAENLRVLSGMRHVLRPGGRVLVDVINRDWFLRNYRASDYVTDDGAFVTRDYETADGRVLLHQNTFLPLRSRLTWEVYDAVADSGTPLFAVDYRMYSAHELVALIEEAGLRLLGLSGDYDGSVFTPLAPRLLCVAERPA